ncbi:response regulator transcription factor [Azospirillum sp. YIM B02556]|uniref:Response regulator transcription factor n=1 Tax=Azospirillum endophyticum TaxID=2800326 RepID=A0ABS1F6W8_9PROT|nr:response regulator transcription factor [Azospirillum endophyticum]MBK1839169.1 response regulator transcription factor [Azospirillum endophyticum]
MTSATATILLVDASRLHRHILRLLLQGTPLSVIGECGNPAEVGNRIAEAGLVPDIILMDISAVADDDLIRFVTMPPTTPASHPVVLDAVLCPRRLATAFNAGVRGYLVKEISPAALVQSLELVLTGERVFPTELAHLLVKRTQAGSAAAAASPEGLGDDDTVILGHLMNGHSNKEIAKSLRTSESHVKVILKRVLRKINVTNRTQAAIWAKRNGVLSEQYSHADEIADGMGLARSS